MGLPGLILPDLREAGCVRTVATKMVPEKVLFFDFRTRTEDSGNKIFTVGDQHCL